MANSLIEGGGAPKQTIMNLAVRFIVKESAVTSFDPESAVTSFDPD